MGSLQQDRETDKARERERAGAIAAETFGKNWKQLRGRTNAKGGTLETDFEGLQGSLSLHIKLSGLVLLLFFFLLLLLWQLACCGALICMRRNYFSLSHVCKSSACAQRGGAKGQGQWQGWGECSAIDCATARCLCWTLQIEINYFVPLSGTAAGQDGN